MNPHTAIRPHLIIRPPKKWVPVDFHVLWDYREILYSLVSRDVKVRYMQTAVIFLWEIIQPLFMMVIFPLFFGRFAKIPSDGVPRSVMPSYFPGCSSLKGSPDQRQTWRVTRGS